MSLIGLHNKHFLVLMGNTMTIIMGFATSFLLFHFLSVKEVGIWFFVLSLVALCEAARNGFLATATVTFYAGTDKERGAKVLGSVWVLVLALSGVIMTLNAVGVALLPYMHSEVARLCVKWVGITYISSVAIDVAGWRLQAEEKYSRIFQYKIINSIVTIIAFIALVALHTMTLEHALLLNVLTNCVVSVIALWYHSGLKYITKRSKECMAELFHYGKYMLGTTSFTALLVNADTWVITFMLGPAAVAVYNLAIRFMAIIDLPLRSLVTTGMSEMAIAYNRNDLHHITYIFKKYTGMLTIVFIPIAVFGILLADLPVNVLGGAQYLHSEAANAFRLFLLASVLFPLDRFNGLALDVLRQTKVNFYKVIIMLGVKVGGNFAGIAMFGNIFGVNLSAFVVVISAIVYGNYQLKKCLNYRIPDILKLGYQEVKLIVYKKLRGYRLERSN
jgi:O-antigen/teichoic acid export membrane protein